MEITLRVKKVTLTHQLSHLLLLLKHLQTTIGRHHIGFCCFLDYYSNPSAPTLKTFVLHLREFFYVVFPCSKNTLIFVFDYYTTKYRKLIICMAALFLTSFEYITITYPSNPFCSLFKCLVLLAVIPIEGTAVILG